MTTAIALEVSKGNFELAVSLGLVLMSISLAVSIALRLLGVARVEAGP
jgi:tungstate transport system permease protein